MVPRSSPWRRVFSDAVWIIFSNKLAELITISLAGGLQPGSRLKYFEAHRYLYNKKEV